MPSSSPPAASSPRGPASATADDFGTAEGQDARRDGQGTRPMTTIAAAPFTLGNVYRWFTDADHWHGAGGIPHRLLEHLVMSGAAVATAVLVAVPVSMWLGHIGKGGTIAVNVSNA